MKQVSTVEFKPGTREELLPDFDAAFPLITSCCDLTQSSGAPSSARSDWGCWSLQSPL